MVNKNASEGDNNIYDIPLLDEDFFNEIKFEDSQNFDKQKQNPSSEPIVAEDNTEFKANVEDNIRNDLDTFFDAPEIISETGSNDNTEKLNEEYDTNMDDILSLLDNYNDAEDVSNDQATNLTELDDIDNFDFNVTKEDKVESKDVVDNSLNDIFSIDDFVDNADEMTMDTFNNSNDISDIFSDVLSVVSSLEDSEEDILNSIPNIEEIYDIENKSNKELKKKEVKKKEIKDKEKKRPNKALKINKKKELHNNTEKETTNKKSIFSLLFGNIIDEKSKKAKQKSEELEKSIEIKKTSKKNEKERIRNSKQSDTLAAKNIKKATKKQELIQKAKIKEKNKLAKDEEKLKRKNERLQKDESAVDRDEGRINRVGATIVIGLCSFLAVYIILGTNAFAYSTSINNASNYFERQSYTKAYNEVGGLKIREKDSELYDKIQTVMFVNKQLNSYNNYNSMKLYPEALDSLLKGLVRYDKYIKYAKELGIENDLKYVRKQIIAEIKKSFSLSEKEAMKIINSDTVEKYSSNIVNAVLEMKK